MDQLAASNTTTRPPLRATHSLGFPSPSMLLQLSWPAGGEGGRRREKEKDREKERMSILA